MENQKSISLSTVEIITLTSSLLLIFGYFMPWLGFISGYQLSSIPKTGLFNEPIANEMELWYSAIHLIPVISILLSINVFIKKPTLNYSSIISIIILLVITSKVIVNEFEFEELSAGYILSMIGIVGYIFLFLNTINGIKISNESKEVTEEVSSGLYQIVSYFLMGALLICILLAIYDKLIL